MAKFKVGDDITLIDNPKDEAVARGIKGYYRVEQVYEDGYDLYSYNLKQLKTKEGLLIWWQQARTDWLSLIKKGRTHLYPVHPGNHESLLAMFDSSYRLCTAEERVLYGKK